MTPDTEQRAAVPRVDFVTVLAMRARDWKGPSGSSDVRRGLVSGNLLGKEKIQKEVRYWELSF